MEFLAGDTFREERYFSLHPVLAHELMMSAPATAPPLPPTPAPEPPSPPTAAIPPPAADATASAATAVADAVRSRPLSPNELGLDSANSGNSMGDGPTQRPTAFPRFGTRNVSSPTVVVARPGQFLSFATPTPVPVLGGTPHRYRSRPRRPSPFPPAQDKRLAHPMSSRPSCPRAVVANLGSLQVIQHGRSERSSQARHRHLHVSSSPRSKGDGRPQYRSRPVVRPSHLPTSFTSSHRHAGRRRARHPRPHKRLETPRCSTYS